MLDVICNACMDHILLSVHMQGAPERTVSDWPISRHEPLHRDQAVELGVRSLT